MSKAFKPGDLALVVKSRTGRNVGSAVELVRCDSSEHVLLPECGPRAFCENPGRVVCWVIRGDFEVTSTLRGEIREEFAACPETWLMPLRDDDLPAEALDTAAPRELVSA